MQTSQKSMKKHRGHAFSQFRLTNDLLNNLSQFEITPTAKLVLLYLSSCYNPKKADMFPKQKTIASRIGISERSIVRAISELIKAGLIIVECKYTNRYKFTSKIVSEHLQIEKKFGSDNLSDNLSQNDIQKDDNLSSHEHEPIREPINEPQCVDDFKILKKYAQSKGAKNVTAYINALKKSGADKQIIKDFKKEKAIEKFHQNKILETERLIVSLKEGTKNSVGPETCLALREVLRTKFGRDAQKKPSF